MIKLAILLITLIFTSHTKASWELVDNWKFKDGYHEITMKTLVQNINCSEGQYLHFPNVMHSIQEIHLDSNPIAYYGLEKKSYIRSIYGSPIIDCRLLLTGNSIQWIVKSPFKFFAEIKTYPEVQDSYEVINKSEVKHLTIYGALALFFLIIFFGMSNNNLKSQAIELSLFSLSMSVFFLSSVFGLVGIKLSILTIDKIATCSLGFATIFYVRFLKERYNLSKYFIHFSNITTIPAVLIIPFLSNGDYIQLLLNIIFAPVIIVVWKSLYLLIKDKTVVRRNKVLNLLALGSFAITTSLDIAYTLGAHAYGMTLGYGVVGTVLFFTRILQRDIEKTYQERDFLRANLESEVERKTNELKVAQAELMQSAKLASLGTLSAGLAHEINNSINYVNGALVPLEKLVSKSISDENQKSKIDKLFLVMKDGLSLTVEIIKSLRNFTGLNQAKFNDVSILETVTSVTTILKNRMRDNIQLDISVSDNHKVFGSTVGLNQVFMNIITNAIDSMSSTGGKLSVKSEEVDGNIIIYISDTGAGIPLKIKDRIFDPFFTTKDVGKGTGLGLFIVKKEIDKHKGLLQVKSDIGHGTTFIIKLPIKLNDLHGVAA